MNATSVRTYAIRFDFPEASHIVYAGMFKGALGWAPSLATALIFTDEDEAFSTLENGYGPLNQRYARVVAVKDGVAV